MTLILITQLFGLGQTKVKAKQKGDVVKVKMLIENPMLSPERAEMKIGDRTKADFIRHIWANVGDTVVFDVATNASLSKNPIFKFKYHYEGRGDTLVVIFKNNKDLESKTQTKIKSSSGKNISLHSKTTHINVIDHSVKYSKVWEATSVDAALDEIYGLHNVITDSRFQLYTPNWPASRGAVPVAIKGTLALESFIIFATNNTQVTVAITTITPQSILDYAFKIKVKEGGEVIVIAKGRDGKLYKALNEAALSVTTVEEMKEKCLKGDDSACCALGNVYRYGRDARGFKVDENETKAYHYKSMAMDLLAKACARNEYKQCYALALCYQNGRGLETNREKALFYFNKACMEGGEAEACKRMAHFYTYQNPKFY